LLAASNSKSNPMRQQHSNPMRLRHNRVRRTLAGALITLADGRLTIEPAPPRSRPTSRSGAGDP